LKTVEREVYFGGKVAFSESNFIQVKEWQLGIGRQRVSERHSAQ
jgi:hypothetical protein